MMRTFQAVAIAVVVLLSAGIGFAAGVVLMAKSEPPQACEPSSSRWERSI